MSDYDKVFGEMISLINTTNEAKMNNDIGIQNYQEVSDEYEKEFPDSVATVDVFNFDFRGEIELDHKLVYLKATIVIINGKLEEIEEIKSIFIQNRHEESIKVFHDPKDSDLKLCNFIVWNISDLKDAIVNEAYEVFCL